MNGMFHRAFESVYQSILDYAHQPQFDADRNIAKNFYTVRRGFPADDDATFLSRTNDFLEDFVFHFRCSRNGRTPFENFLADHQHHLPPEELLEYEELRSQLSSLFEVHVKQNENCLLLKDLLNSQKFEHVQLFRNSESFFYLNSGELLIGKLFSLQKKFYLSPGLTAQPSEAKRNIFRLLKGYRKLQHLVNTEAKDFELSFFELLEKRNSDFGQIQKKDFQNKKLSDKLYRTKALRKFSKKYMRQLNVLKLANVFRRDPFLTEESILKHQAFLDFLMRCELRYRTYQHLNIDSVYVYDSKSYLPILF